MRETVFKELKTIESEANVRVLLAVESGSRAWGFASPDSDYDVRFIYVHEPNWYWTIFEERDVIEKMLPGDLDVSGWELRKSLRLGDTPLQEHGKAGAVEHDAGWALIHQEVFVCDPSTACVPLDRAPPIPAADRIFRFGE